MKEKLKVIFLDWNGTLSDSFFWEHMRKSENQSIKDLYDLWDRALFSRSKEYIQEWMRGLKTTESVLKEISIETGTEYGLILKEFIKGCESMTLVSEELPEIIRKLREKGVYVVIATNNMDCFTRWTVPSLCLDTMFDEILNSFDLKGLKNDIDVGGESIFFKDFFLENAISPRECIFFDDSVDKGDFISKMGIRYVKVGGVEELIKSLESLC